MQLAIVVLQSNMMIFKIYGQNIKTGSLVLVLGIPSNQFETRTGTEKEIKEFCEVNFNISSPMTSKTDVKVKMREIYKWAFKNYGKSLFKMEFPQF